MKALSIRHPWIEAILSGHKTIEVRAWATRHRGPLLLHAPAAFGVADKQALAHLLAEGVRVSAPTPERLGAVLGEAQLVDCRPLRESDWAGALMEPVEGRLWAWELADVRPLGPIPARGERMLFEVEPQPSREVAAGDDGEK